MDSLHMDFAKQHVEETVVEFYIDNTSLIMSCSSASVGFCPSERITVASS